MSPDIMSLRVCTTVLLIASLLVFKGYARNEQKTKRMTGFSFTNDDRNNDCTNQSQLVSHENGHSPHTQNANKCRNENLRVAMSWNVIDFAFPDELTRNKAIYSREYVPLNNMPLGIDVWNDRLFLTVPRRRPGVAATLNTVSLTGGIQSPLLKPYPSWEANKIPSDKNVNKKIISAYRFRIDSCDRLWLVDTGSANVSGALELFAGPRILVYDLKTDQLIREYSLKNSDYRYNSFFANIVVDVTLQKCDKAFAYLPDLGSYAVVVYSWFENDSWRVTHHFFHMDPFAGNYYIGGVNIQYTDGVFGIALSAVNTKTGYRIMYFHPLSSLNEFAVSTEIMQNKKLASDNYYEYEVIGSRGLNSQAGASFFDERTGIIFYTQINKDAVGCWNSIKHAEDYSSRTNGIVASNNKTMVYPSDLKVDRHNNLWVISNKFPLQSLNRLSMNEINYRIFMAPVSLAIQGTVCSII